MLNAKRGFKATAIACAVLLTCATSQLFTSTINYTSVNAVSVSSTYDVEKNTDGTTTGKIHIDTGDYTSVTVTLTGGKSGATTSGEVGYWDSKASKWVGKVDTWEEKTFDTNGKLTLTVKVPANTSDVQIMLTYYADWSSGKENLLDKNSIKATVESGSSSGNTGNDGGNTGNDGGNTGNDGGNTGNDGGNTGNATMPSNAECNWTDITEGTTNNQSKNLVSESVSGDKKTVTITQGGQWSAYDEGNEPIILDQTWKPEAEGQYDTDSGNEKITNSNNFMFANDFGVPTGAEINHFRFTVESDEPMYQVQFGAGISVKKGSEIANSGSTDASGNITDKIWFNESGTFDPENEDDYASLENSNGKKYYGFNRGKTAGETNYIQLQWDVYDDVKPSIQNDSWSSVSFQYWYGVDPADWDKIDWENPPENPDIEHKPAQVNITEATCNYNVTETYDYTDTASQSVDLEAFGDMTGVKFSDLGLTENDKPKAVTFTVSGDGDIGKLVGAFGVSVTDDCPTDNLESANWYQSDNVVYEDCGSTYEITWIIPSDIAKYINPEYDAEVKFGCWYAGAGENALSSLKITNVSVDYASQSEVTTTSATTTTPITTTVAPIKDGIKGDLINLGMGPIDPADDDETSPTFHQFSIEPITQILPKDYNPSTDDIAQIIFNISSPVEMKDIAAACGVAVSLDCKDATDEYWYQGDDFKVTDSGKKITITWTVPESIREYIQENQYGKVNLGIWYAGEGVDEVYLDSAQVVYTSKGSDITTTTPITTTTSITTTTPITTTTTSVTTTTPSTTTTKATTTTTDDITTTSGTSTEDTLWGDANVDSNVKSNDLLAIRKQLLHLEDLTEQGKINADVNHDGQVRSNDIIKIKRYLLHLISKDDLATKD